MPETWAVDGYVLNDNNVRGIEFRGGLYGTPGIDGQDSRIAGRHGVLPGRRNLGAGAFALSMWLSASSRGDLEVAYDTLIRRAIRTDRLCTWTRTLAGGTTRECQGYVADRFEPTPVGQLVLRVNVAVVVPAGLWKSSVSVDTGDLPLGAGGRVDLPQFAAATAPMDYLRFVLRNVTDGRVVDARTGRGFTRRGVLSVATFDAATWLNAELLDYDGPTILDLSPGDASGPPAVIVTGTTSASTTLRVIGRPGFLA